MTQPWMSQQTSQEHLRMSSPVRAMIQPGFLTHQGENGSHLQW